MNPRLQVLQPYPFERLNALKAGVVGNPAHAHIALSIGEPKHPPPPFLIELLSEPGALAADLATYPATRGSPALREAIAHWLQQRFSAGVDPETGILPVAGTREALFSFAQAVLSGAPGSVGIAPNPFYQIYEGALLLGGARPCFVDCPASNDYLPDYRAVTEDVWRRCELLFLCSPGNPTGRVLDRDTLEFLIGQAQRHDFILAADECYSEIYFDEAKPPLGLLQVARDMGLSDYRRCVVFHSLSKRSNLPGLRSGFVAGDSRVLEAYLLYRTYHGCALGAHVQRASTAAWSDEDHVRANRALYVEKFSKIHALLSDQFQFREPEGGFYHWLNVGEDDRAFARDLFRDENITVLPGSFLSREGASGNPGQGHVRVAWVAPLAETLSAAQRLCRWAQRRSPL
ncbi:MAG: succinyldiaminopimelate transaminase [Pseudomonadales bacterium]|nr:succinyldiaminopimelate transaminase [Pseudomonadales bacterium]